MSPKRSKIFINLAFEEQFKNEVNFMRSDPQAYARLIEAERRPYYQDKIFAAPGAFLILFQSPLLEANMSYKVYKGSSPGKASLPATMQFSSLCR